MSELRFDPDWTIAPGETLQEWFEWSKLPKSIAPTLYDIDEDTLDGILEGTTPISPEIALKLDHMTQIGALMWLSLEQNFRAGLAAGKHWIRGNDDQ